MDERELKLADKVALITGAASGIGRATALLFAREGARVVVVDINQNGGQDTVETIRQGGGEAIFVLADVTSAADAERMVKTAVETYGQLDILFNNAGVAHRASVDECSVEDWDRVIAINLKGVFLGSKYAIPVMKRQGGGTIINTASGAGLVGTVRSPAYCASKGGVVLLTKQMAIDFARDNIRVNAICPGAVDTPLMEIIFREMSDDLAEGKRIYEERLPRGRMLAPEQVAHAALYLACDESGFMTGNPFMV
jgi:NAD(P)-dependent dehydrogenase (short-subunit alcohol dehydrogenase family)